MKSIYHKWDTCNPASGEARYGVRFKDETGQWIVRLKVGHNGLFKSAAERDAWLTVLRKKERKIYIEGMH